jgi:hypothetical protein
MSKRTSLAAALPLLLILLAEHRAQAQMVFGPSGRASYVEVHGEAFRDFDGIDGAVGGAVEFGSFQNRYIAAGTVLQLERPGAVTGLPMALYFGGGFSVHIPIGPHFLIIPELSLGYRLVDSSSGLGGGLAAYGQLGAAYRLRTFYIGLDVQRPIYLELPTLSSGFFPNLTTGGLFVGLYF